VKRIAAPQRILGETRERVLAAAVAAIEAVNQDGSQPSGHLCLSSELVQVGIGSEKGILNRVFCVGSITQDALCPSVQWGQATSENLIQLLSHPLFTSNCFALIRHVVFQT